MTVPRNEYVCMIQAACEWITERHALESTFGQTVAQRRRLHYIFAATEAVYDSIWQEEKKWASMAFTGR